MSKAKLEKINDLEIHVQKIEQPQETKSALLELPDCFNMCICAPKQQGKSQLLFNIVNNLFTPSLYKIIIYSPTHQLDKGYIKFKELLKNKGFATFAAEEFKPEDFNTIIRESEKYKAKGIKLVLIFDDMGDKLRSDIIPDFLLKNRHYSATCILVLHNIKNIKPLARNQIQRYYFRGQSNPQLDFIYKEICNEYIEDYKFKKIYEHCTAKPYQFLGINKDPLVFYQGLNNKYVFIPKGVISKPLPSQPLTSDSESESSDSD